MANLAGWPYWKVISVTGQAGAGTDYQVELEIGDSAGGDFHLEGHCTNFPQDIRITDDDGTTLLDHWVEDLTADPIVVHVEVKDDLGSNQDIRVYYGKNGETTASNITSTFIFGDDFETGSVPDATKWTTVAGGLTVSGGNLVITGTTGTRGIIEQNTANYPAISQGVIIETKGYANQDNQVSQHFCAMRGAGSYNNRVDTYGSITYLSSRAGTYEHDIFASLDVLSPHNYMAKWYSGNAKYYHDDVLKQTHTTRVPTVDMVVFFTEGTVASSIFYIDWVFVRKYNSPEPAFSSAGAEQRPGLVPVFIRHNPALTGGMV